MKCYDEPKAITALYESVLNMDRNKLAFGSRMRARMTIDWFMYGTKWPKNIDDVVIWRKK